MKREITAIDIHTHCFLFEPVCNDEQLNFAQKVTGLYHNGQTSLDLVFRKQAAGGIGKSVISAIDLTSQYGRGLSTNEECASFSREYPDHFIGFASVDPHDEVAAAKLERAFEDYNLKGLYLFPSLQEFYPDEKAVQPLYELCEKYDKPVYLDCGCSSYPGLLTKYGHPMAVEPVAIRFPKLRICIARFGWPWIREVCMIMLKNHNVYTDTSIVYFDDPPRMYHQMMEIDIGPTWVDRSLRHQVMFGSGDPGLEQVRQVNALRNMPFRDSTLELVLYRNALEFLGVEKDMRWLND